MTIQEFEEKLLQYIDDSIDAATNDELFAGGYLRGHISLAAAECELNGLTDLASMKDKIVDAVEQSKSELTPQDYVLVQRYINELLG
ncbi:YfcL family protein [Photobacterium damselae]|uniref:YfcL family protein n=1 Tax=Photobacterium damselae TaxID=38293 RepID=UPI002F400212